jgi:hypothetical protein
MKYLLAILAVLVLGLMGFGFIADSQADLEMAKAMKYQSQAALVDKSMDAALMAIVVVLGVGMLTLGGLALYYRAKSQGYMPELQEKANRRTMLPRAERGVPMLGTGMPGSAIDQLVQLEVLKALKEMRREEVERL